MTAKVDHGDQAERTGALAGRDLVAAARTHRGTVREHNEDAFVCRPDLGLFAVIDGMGGENAGEKAAAMARQSVLDETDPVRAISAANQRIHGMAQGDTGLKGMGCVASAVRIDGGGATIGHVGDTRVYLTSKAGAEQLTRDHTIAAHRQEEEGIDERRARDIGGRNQVTRDIGGQPRPGDDWIDRIQVDLEEGDLLLLCSDGLHGVLRNGELFARLREARRDKIAPEALADSLIDLALERGTRDNVTVVAVRRLPGKPPAEPAAERKASSNLPGLLLFILGLVLGYLARGFTFWRFWEGW
ncbi:MAG TPA: PP2C family serine/threonine-protein phosphatase [Vicinamibacteria bacterium]